MSWRHGKAAGELALRAPTQKAVLLALAHHANEYSGHCWPSVERLALFTGLSRRAVQQAIADLIAGNHLIVTERKGKPNVYTMTLAGAEPIDQHEGGAPPAPLSGKGVHLLHPGGAPPAPEHSKKDTHDARASIADDWKPSEDTVKRIIDEDALTVDEIEAERETFILRNQADDNVVKNPDAAFRLWCRRRRSLKHPPPAPRRGRAASEPVIVDEALCQKMIDDAKHRLAAAKASGDRYAAESVITPALRQWEQELVKIRATAQPKENTA